MGLLRLAMESSSDRAFQSRRAGLVVTVGQDSQMLLLSGVPLNEPIDHYGPFVMNKKQELIAAIEDFNSGRFGRLADQSAPMP